MNGRILFRADGSLKIGFGHIYRVFAVAEMLKKNRECVLATSMVNEIIAAECERLEMAIVKLPPVDYPSPNDRAESDEIPFDMNDILHADDTVVTDGYWFGPEFQKQTKERAARLICIDDLVSRKYVADIIINHAPGVKASDYITGNETRLCLGLDYLILRPPFFSAIKRKADLRKAIYLSFGGADFYGLSLKYLAQCLRTDDTTGIHVLMSSSFDNELVNKLTRLQQSNPEQVHLHKDLNGAEITDLIDSCTHAFTGASTVALEVAARGLKPLIGHYADNQRNIYDGLIQNGLASGAGRLLDDSDVPLEGYLGSDARTYRHFNNEKLLAIFE